MARFFRALSSRRAEEEAGKSFAEWLDASLANPDLKLMLRALLRLTTYCDEPTAISAKVALDQIRRGTFDGVDYLDGGWQQLTEALRTTAELSDARIIADEPIARIEHDDRVRALITKRGDRIPVSGAIIATPPRIAAELLEGRAREEIEQIERRAVPVKAACLDVALDRYSSPARFVLGIDRPLYLSVHSATAKLAPPGKALIHTMKYLSRTEPSDPARDQSELEGLLSLVEPSWREALVEKQFLPEMTVYHALIPPERPGEDGRAPGPVASVRGLHLAGDWVGPDHLLADAAFASGRSAALALQAETWPPAAEAA